MMEDRSRSILLIGGPNTGKTHFGGQLLGRLQLEQGKLRLRSEPESIAPLEDVLRRLAQGLLADHTSVDTYEEIVLPIALPSGEQVDLVWPDYGGEQIRLMMHQRRVSDAWKERIRGSDSWLLFMRPSILHTYDDIFTRPLHELTAAEGNDPAPHEWTSQAFYIELLQLLLYVRGLGTLTRATAPPLAIVLSCWDELDTEDRALPPPMLLRQEMPLFAAFLESTWQSSSVAVLGLSSLDRPLSNEREDEAYIERGPETFGYVVRSDAEQTSDLAVPIQWLLDKTE